MRQFLLNESLIGKMLVKPVISGGKTLLAAGIVLNAKHLSVLKAWGIRQVFLECNAEDVVENKIDNVLSAQTAIDTNVDYYFSKCINEDDLVCELRRLAKTLRRFP